MALPSIFTNALQLMFNPGDVKPIPDKKSPLKNMTIGLFMGMTGFIIQGIYIVPGDEINFGALPGELEFLLNKLSGGLLGFLLFLLLFGFESLVLLLFSEVKSTPLLHGSFAPFMAMPMLTIPVHEAFGGELSLRGYWMVVHVFIIVFLAWHAMYLGIYLLRDVGGNGISRNKALGMITVLVVLDIVLGIAFITFVPMAFNASPLQFLEEYF